MNSPNGPSARVELRFVALTSNPKSSDVALPRSNTGLVGVVRSMSSTRLKLALGFTVTLPPVKSLTPGRFGCAGRPKAVRSKFNGRVADGRLGVKSRSMARTPPDNVKVT